jgi:hypothetical protein
MEIVNVQSVRTFRPQPATELVGQGNALLNQSFVGDALLQCQLTTLTIGGWRYECPASYTRSAQGFRNGMPLYTSFYREVKVTKEELYAELDQTFWALRIWITRMAEPNYPVEENIGVGSS